MMLFCLVSVICQHTPRDTVSPEGGILVKNFLLLKSICEAYVGPYKQIFQSDIFSSNKEYPFEIAKLLFLSFKNNFLGDSLTKLDFLP